jgi:CHASE3 domain sensor protein
MQTREEEPTIEMKLSEMRAIVEQDRAHENTQLALKVRDGEARIRRIIEFNQTLESMRQPRKVARPMRREEYKEPTPEREKELNKKVADAEEYGLPPEEEDLLGKPFE